MSETCPTCKQEIPEDHYSFPQKRCGGSTQHPPHDWFMRFTPESGQYYECDGKTVDSPR